MDFKLKKFKNEVVITRMANIHYFEFVKEYHTFMDRHPFRELIYIDSGSIVVESENFSGVLKSKELIIHQSDELHSLSCKDNNAPNVVIIGFECNCPMLDYFSKHPVALTPEQIKILTEVIKEGRSVFDGPYDVPNIRDMKKKTEFTFGADQMIKIKLEMFLIELIRSIVTPVHSHKNIYPDKKTEEIATYIDNNFCEKITLDDLCFLFGTNKTTLCKNFKSTYNETIIDYINKLRIKKAKELLRQGDLNLTQLSSRVGFSSIHYFSKIFKSYEKKSPSEYIKSIKSTLDI